ncbi:MAG: ERAP1-like C-terminal domain-containing protein [Cytophagaceae bacterium]|nr:ERAP1-like C-terminal domain-containing protein [Gemmatimonadaceae bacterium]
MAPGVPIALAQYRAARVGDVRYDLVMNVSDADTARGRVSLRFNRLRPGDAIIDFRGPILGRVRVNGVPVTDVVFNGAHLRIPQRLLRSGENHVEIEFGAVVAAAGASIIRVRDPVDRRTYLYTLLVPSDANQLFPCFDQPDLKAKVTLTLTTPRDWRAVANGIKVKSDSTSRGLVHSFRETEPISTYLIAFAAGPWAEVRTKGTRKPITLYVRQSRLADVDADSIIVANDRAATWLERYFNSRFPFQKLDVVLAPAFPFGGMEHPGAIFYSEERFVYRERPTLPQLLGRTATIYHEVAHQWFGDYVTMRWFDDLWLKEGFATYMAARMQDALDPASQAWKSFYLRNKPAAYAVDLTEGTTPVWQRLANLDQAKSNYGAIVYNKAPSVLKQLNYLVGDSAFRVGLQRFLRRHSYANATWRDLLSAVGTASGRSLAAWGDAYILRAGMPIIEQRAEVRDGRVVSFSLVQRPARELSGRRAWPIRTELLAVYEGGEVQRIPLTITAETTAVAELVGKPAPQFTFANAQDYAYALVLLDPGSVATLERDIGSISDPFLRTMLWGALWDLVREAMLGPDRFLRAALRELPAETDEQLVGGLLARIARATTAYLGDVQRAAFLPDVERALLAGTNDARKPYGLRKAHLDTYIRVAATEPAAVLLDGMLDSTTIAGDSLRPPVRWAIVTRLVALGAPTASARLAAEEARDVTPEGARRSFVARAARVDPATKAEYFRRYFDDRDLNEDWATASLDAFNTLEAQQLTRAYLTPALDSLGWIQKNRRIFYLGAWIGGFVEGQTSEEALQIVRAFLDGRPNLAADLRNKVLQSADELERTVRIRKAFGLEAPRANDPP